MTTGGGFEGVENRYRFQGREWDAHSGTYYFRNRTYIPEWGIFTGPDMKRELESNGPCNYLFANNNPLRYVDPEGLDRLRDNLIEATRKANRQRYGVLNLQRNLGASPGKAALQCLKREYDVYVILYNTAGRHAERFMESESDFFSYYSSRDAAAMSAYQRLPGTIGRCRPSLRQLEDMMAKTKAIGRACDDVIATQHTQIKTTAAVKSGATTVAVGIVIVYSGGAAYAIAPGAVTTFGGLAAGTGVTKKAIDRYHRTHAAGDQISWVQAGYGGFADFVGVAGISEGVTDRDFLTGRKLGMSAEQQGSRLGGGIGRVIVIVASPSVFKRGNNWARSRLGIKDGYVLVTRWDNPAPNNLRSGCFVQRGGKNFVNQLLTGVVKARPSSFQVPKSSLKWPGGWDGLTGKGFFGQRIYSPDPDTPPIIPMD